MFDVVLLGISKSWLKSSLKKIIFSTGDPYYKNYVYNPNSKDNLENKMKEALKKYELDKIELIAIAGVV